jgi:hypothetical protein
MVNVPLQTSIKRKNEHWCVCRRNQSRVLLPKDSHGLRVQYPHIQILNRFMAGDTGIVVALLPWRPGLGGFLYPTTVRVPAVVSADIFSAQGNSLASLPGAATFCVALSLPRPAKKGFVAMLFQRQKPFWIRPRHIHLPCRDARSILHGLTVNSEKITFRRNKGGKCQKLCAKTPHNLSIPNF